MPIPAAISEDTYYGAKLLNIYSDRVKESIEMPPMLRAHEILAGESIKGFYHDRKQRGFRWIYDIVAGGREMNCYKTTRCKARP